MTLKDLVSAKKCRKGKADGITKRGAFWRPCEPIQIRSYGGDGIGQNGVDWNYYLHLRHYRSGDVSAIIHHVGWHQDHWKRSESWTAVAGLEDCDTAEAVVARLKGITVEGQHVLGSDYQQPLIEKLVAMGFAESEPSPDEE